MGFLRSYHRKNWERLAKANPYHAVLTDPRFAGNELDDASRREFFASGVRDIDRLLDGAKRHVGLELPVGRALEFGCGVGRLLTPLAAHCGRLVGADVSETMLAAARANLTGRGVANCELVPWSDAAPAVRGPFDLVLSFVVFQHIHPSLGLPILRALLGVLAPGGVGILHFATAEPPGVGRIGRRLRNHPVLLRSVEAALGRMSWWAPKIEMYAYPMDEVLGEIRAVAAGEVGEEATDHGGQEGAILFFRRSGP